MFPGFALLVSRQRRKVEGKSHRSPTRGGDEDRSVIEGRESVEERTRYFASRKHRGE